MENEISSSEDLLSYPSFRRWVRGMATKQEADKWDQWCRKNEANRKAAADAQAKLLGMTPVLSEKEISRSEWERFFRYLKKVQKNKLHSHRQIRPILWAYRAAAAMLVIAITGFLTFNFHETDTESGQEEIVWQQVYTSNAELKTIKLTDGSSITLSANSSLSYLDGWTVNSQIEVELSGEAYFSIPHKESQNSPFKVRTPDGIVVVTGTEFVVDADDKRTRVVLDRGSVKISRDTSEVNQPKEIDLKPNQMAEFSKFEESISIKEVNPEIYTSWRNNKLVLENTPLHFLAEKIEKIYGVEVKVSDPELYKRKLTGSMKLKSLNHLLEAITEVLKIEATERENTVFFKSESKT